MRRRLIIVILMVVVALAVTGGIAYAALASTPGSLSQSTWTLTRLVVGGQEQPLSTSRPATLRFLADQGQVAGSGGCNSFGATYLLVGNQLRISGLQSTLVACVGFDGSAAMSQESAYFQALPLVTSYTLGGSALTLTGDSGNVSLTFRAS